MTPRIHGIDFYLAWCKEYGYEPIMLKVMGSNMFGTNTPKTKDIDFYGLHVQPPIDFLGMNEQKLVHHLEYELCGITYEYKFMDIKHFLKMIRKGSINEILFLFKEFDTMYLDRIYNNRELMFIDMVACYHLPKTLGNAVFGLMNGNFQKYVVNRGTKNHKIYKKFLHIFSIGWAYYRLLFKLAHCEEGMYHYLGVNFRLPKLVAQHEDIKHLINLKAENIPLSEIQIDHYSILYRDFVVWLTEQEEKYKKRVQLEISPVWDDWLMNFRLRLFN